MGIRFTSDTFLIERPSNYDTRLRKNIVVEANVRNKKLQIIDILVGTSFEET
jgi:hypothetical protein